MDTPDIYGPSYEPASGENARQLVVLLHGLGADGYDLINMAPELARFLPNAAFVSPTSPFLNDMGGPGYQWFSFQDQSSKGLLDSARLAEALINAFIDKELAKRNLSDDKLAFVGFSQGGMVSLHTALRRPKPCAAVLSFSGALLGPEYLAQEKRSAPPVCLIHGDADPVVPFASLKRAETALKSAGITVEGHTRPGMGHGIDPEAMRLGGTFLARHLRKSQW